MAGSIEGILQDWRIRRRAAAIQGPDEPSTTAKVIIGIIAFSFFAAGIVLDVVRGNEPQVRLTADELVRRPFSRALPMSETIPGVRTIVLSGDPSQTGPYVLRLIIPPQTTILSRTHSDDRTATVVSGVFFFGYGSENTPNQTKNLPQASFFTEPAGVPHFGATTSEGAVIDVSGTGPTDTHIVHRQSK